MREDGGVISFAEGKNLKLYNKIIFLGGIVKLTVKNGVAPTCCCRRGGGPLRRFKWGGAGFNLGGKFDFYS